MSIINLATNRSLWIDEAMLAQNIVSLSFAQLFEPLRYYYQMAPIGFLLVEKLFYSLIHSNELTLRLFPFICSMCSLFVLGKIFTLITANKTIRLFGLAFMAISYYNIYYAAEVKQYMTELLGSLVMIYLYLIYRKKRPNYPLVILGISGTIFILFANIAVIILFVIGILLIVEGYANEKKIDKERLLVITTWALAFSAYYILFYFNHPSEAYMKNFWKNVDGFFPYNIFSTSFLRSCYNKFVSVISLTGQGYKLIPLMVLGVLFLWRKSKVLSFLLLAPILVHAAMAYLKLYPIFPRLILYFLPVLLILTSLGFQYLLEKFIKLSNVIYSLMFLLLLYNLFAYTKWGFPIQRQEIKKVMAHLNERIDEDDEILIYHTSTPAYVFYKDQFENLDHINAKEVFIGNHKNDWNLYLNYTKELDENVWLLVSEANWVLNADRKSELDMIIDQIIDKGYIEKDHVKSFGVDLYRYELE
ncbi:MAG: glycosyltransferase family 39 protein [Saprospiraceae bacterium]|nr:glycosyltransferase family 39 protein [Saprospiraceae bacterium]